MKLEELRKKYEEINAFVPAKVPVIKVSTPFQVSFTREISSYWAIQMAYCNNEFIIYVIEGQRQLKRFFEELENVALYISDITFLI